MTNPQYELTDYLDELKSIYTDIFVHVAILVGMLSAFAMNSLLFGSGVTGLLVLPYLAYGYHRE